jgi:DNA-binding NtrC family response regulator
MDARMSPSHFGALIGSSPAMRQLFEQLERIAATSSTVLIEGETGSGKELVARELVLHGDRRARPLVMFECDGARSAELELELFGEQRGAFTGAVGRPGALAHADGGTLVFDEIAALPSTAQARLLRVIETRSLHRVGASGAWPIDVRIIAITRENLAARCQRGLFRRDLYFCLRALRVRVPPLRERLDDLPLLVERFTADEGGSSLLARDEAFSAWLRRRYWKGNVRELRNVLMRVRVLGLHAVLTEPEDPPPASAVEHHQDRSEHDYVLRLLRESEGNVSQAACLAHQTSSWLRRRIRHHGIDLAGLRSAV